MRLPLALALATALSSVAAMAEVPIAERIELCVSCHGADGRPIEPDYPVIAGQQYYYLYVQLRDYQSGLRANEIMQEIVAELTREEMQALARHFAEQPWPNLGLPAASEAETARARSLEAAGQCSQCHLAHYLGDSRIPRLAGQQPGYLARTMREFRDRLRRNAPDISALFRDYTDDDITAMAHYLAGR